MDADPSFRSLIELYTGLLLSLKLDNKTKPKSFFASSEVAYSFTVERAVEVLQRPLHTEDLGRPVSHAAAKRLLAAFCECHLLHDPSKRVHGSLLMRTRLQSTAKGLALAQRTCKERGIYCKELIKYLCSIYNSLAVIRLERNEGFRVVNSPSFISFLWSQMLGSKPNVHDECPQSSFIVSAPDSRKVVGDVNMLDQFADEEFVANPEKGVSPYHHKFFLHPASGATTQYFESKSGVRLFARVSFKQSLDSRHHGDDTSLRKIKSSITFLNSSYIVYKMPLVVSGRALWQWLMDCTDVLSKYDAVRIVDQLIQTGYILRVRGECLDSICCEDDLPAQCSREAFYAFSELGLSISTWDSASIDLALTYPKIMVEFAGTAVASGPGDFSSSSSGTVSAEPEPEKQVDSLKIGSVEELRRSLCVGTVIQEPGLRAIFREQLSRIHAEENILYCEEYSRLKPLVRKLENGMENKDSSKQYKAVLFSCSRELELMIKKFLLTSAPLELNISGRDRSTFEDYIKHKQELDSKNTPEILAPIILHTFNMAGKVYHQTIESLASLLEQALLDDKLASQFHHHYARPQVAMC